MMCDLLRLWGFSSPDGTVWTGGGYTARVDEHPDLTAAVLEAARDVRWAALGKTRWNFAGLTQGRDDAISDAHGKNLKTAFNIGRWNVIQADGVHTPYRQFQKAGGGPTCPHCHAAVCDWEHILWKCPHYRSAAGALSGPIRAAWQAARGAPRCL